MLKSKPRTRAAISRPLNGPRQSTKRAPGPIEAPTIKRNMDAEDKLSLSLCRGFALADVCAAAAGTLNHDPRQMQFALEALRDLLNDGIAALGNVEDVLSKVFPERKDEPAPVTVEKTSAALKALAELQRSVGCAHKKATAAQGGES